MAVVSAMPDGYIIYILLPYGNGILLCYLLLLFILNEHSITKCLFKCLYLKKTKLFSITVLIIIKIIY